MVYSSRVTILLYAVLAMPGRKLLDVVAELEQGKLSENDLPLSVVKHGEEHFTLNNRSLYVALTCLATNLI